MGEQELWIVVVNDRGQHSVWPADRPTPPGWQDIGHEGQRQQCLDHIESIWTDIAQRPLHRGYTR